ncbi:MAG: TetR/AcrR family transcriptional regulator [Deltaproteobacteria bacterium]|nr:MAG: TetR/AcrR family transcriptional regulator [Deltaproteobacteria bacterium]
MPPLPRYERLDGVVKQRLFEAARAEFAAEGFHGASLNRIIAAAGTSKGAVYYSFEDKADLFATTVRQSLAHWAEEVGWPETWPTSRGAFWSEIARLTRDGMRLVQEDPEGMQLAKAFYQLSGDAQAPRVVAELLDEARDLLTAVLVSGQQNGAVRSDMPLTLLAHSTFALGLALDRWVVDAVLQGRELAGIGETFLDMMKRLVAPSGDGEEAP